MDGFTNDEKATTITKEDNENGDANDQSSHYSTSLRKHTEYSTPESTKGNMEVPESPTDSNSSSCTESSCEHYTKRTRSQLSKDKN